jgi:hypothetical protein
LPPLLRRQLYQIKKDSYKHLRERQKGSFWKKLKINIVTFKISTKFLSIIAIILIVLSGLYFALFSQALSIDQIVFKPDNPAQLDANKYLNKNILGFSVYSVEDYLRKTYPDVDKVYVRKIFPDKLEIEYTTFKFKFIYMDLAGYSIISEDYRVVRSENFEIPLVLTDFERKILTGLATPEDDVVKEFYRNKLSEEEKKEFKWENISEEVKIDELNQIKFNLDITLKEYLQQKLTSIESTSLNFPIIIFFNENNLLNQKFQDQELVDFLFIIYEDLNELDLNIKNLRFTSKERVEVHLEDEKVLIFSFYRSWDDQLVDLKSVIYNGKLVEGKFFDFRTRNFSVAN